MRSEQATVHSAPSPWSFSFEMNETVNLLAADLKLFGPLFWQNLGNTMEEVNTHSLLWYGAMHVPNLDDAFVQPTIERLCRFVCLHIIIMFRARVSAISRDKLLMM